MASPNLAAFFKRPCLSCEVNQELKHVCKCLQGGSQGHLPCGHYWRVWPQRDSRIFHISEQMAKHNLQKIIVRLPKSKPNLGKLVGTWWNMYNAMCNATLGILRTFSWKPWELWTFTWEPCANLYHRNLANHGGRSSQQLVNLSATQLCLQLSSVRQSVRFQHVPTTFESVVSSIQTKKPASPIGFFFRKIPPPPWAFSTRTVLILIQIEKQIVLFLPNYFEDASLWNRCKSCRPVQRLLLGFIRGNPPNTQRLSGKPAEPWETNRYK